MTKGRGGGGGGGVWGIGGAAVAAEGAGGAQTDTPVEEAREEEEEEADPHTVRGLHATVAAASAPWLRLKRSNRSASNCLARSASSFSIASKQASANFPSSVSSNLNTSVFASQTKFVTVSNKFGKLQGVPDETDNF